MDRLGLGLGGIPAAPPMASQLSLLRVTWGGRPETNVRLHGFNRSLEYETSGHVHDHVKLWEHVWNGTGWIWRDAGREVAAQPATLVQGDTDGLSSDDLRINLYVTGLDGRLREGTRMEWDGVELG